MWAVLRLRKVCSQALVGHFVHVSTVFAGVFSESSPFFGRYALSKRHGTVLAKLYSRAFGLLWGKNDARRNLIHVDDVAEVIARVVSQRVIGQFSCIAPANMRYLEILEMAISAFGGAGRVVFESGRPDIHDNGFEFHEDLYQRIGYLPRISLCEGFAREAARRKAAA